VFHLKPRGELVVQESDPAPRSPLPSAHPPRDALASASRPTDHALRSAGHAPGEPPPDPSFDALLTPREYRELRGAGMVTTHRFPLGRPDPTPQEPAEGDFTLHPVAPPRQRRAPTQAQLDALAESRKRQAAKRTPRGPGLFDGSGSKHKRR
jgi:hypothetical protein